MIEESPIDDRSPLNIMSFILIILAVILAPLSSIIPIKGTDVWFSQYVVVALFCYLAIAISVARMSVALAIFYTYCIYSSIIVSHMHPLSMVYLTQIGLALLMATHISKMKAKNRGYVWLAIFGALMLQCLLGFLQSMNLDPFFRYAYDITKDDTVGFSGSHNQYGLFLAASSAATWLVSPWFLLISAAALFLSKTLSTLLAFAVSVVFAAWSIYSSKNVWKIVVALIVTVVLFCFFIPKGSQKIAERLDLWELSIEQVASGKAIMKINDKISRVMTARPWEGFGLGSFFKISPLTQDNIIDKRYSHRYEHAHNDYVECLFDLGYVGFASLLFVFYEIVKRYLSVAKKSKALICSMAALISYFVSALGIYTVHVAVGGFYLAIFLGLFYGGLKDA